MSAMRYVTNSELMVWKRCRRRWWLAYVRKLALRSESITGPAALGNRVHRALATYYVPDGEERGDPIERVELDRKGELQLYPEQAKEINKECDFAVIMLTGYFEWLEETGADQGLKVIGSETRVEHPIPGTNVTLLSKQDVVLEREMDGARLFMDHKGQPLTGLVLTQMGWRKMGDLVVGDEVIGSDGRPTRIVGVYDLGEQDIYRVRFRDKSWLDVTDDHLWALDSPGCLRRMMTTRELIHGHARYYPNNDHIIYPYEVPLVTQPVMFDPFAQPLPIDPYTLGVLLGDGSFRNNTLTCGYETIVSHVARVLGGRKIRRVEKSNGNPLWGCSLGPVARRQLTELGLNGRYSYEKFIPESYLRASVEERRALLAGLLDTDGARGRLTRFCTSSERLAQDVGDLVRGLGGVAHQTNDGFRTVSDRTGWQIGVWTSFCPFALADDKVEMWRARRWRRKVVGVELIDRAPARCIRVVAPDHLYVAENYVVTHNTVQNLADPLKTLQLDEQVLLYHLIHRLLTEQRVDGALYNMLRKTKRTEKATPPFYARHEVRHNDQQLRSMWIRVMAQISDLLEAQARLEGGEDHRAVTYPTPDRSCAWQCPFLPACPILDEDPVSAEAMLSDLYVERDPLARYEDASELLS